MAVVGDLRVWWIPQVPMVSFYVPVKTVEQGRWLCGVLAAYDTFQYEQNVKPDYANVGGVQIFEDGDGSRNNDWFDVEEDE